MSSRKRKRHSKDIKCVFFPDDAENGLQKVGKEASALSTVSSAKSWEKCGDSFLETPVIKNFQSSGRKLSAIRKLAQSAAAVQTGACHEDPVHIAWSSSDSEQSDNETQAQHLSRVVTQLQHRSQRSRRPMAPTQSYTRALRMLSTSKDDLPDIDTDSDLDESEEDAEKDSGQQISDCESESCDEKQKDLPLQSANVKELEISGYVSDGENVGSTLTSSRLDSEIFPLQSGEGSKRSVSDWVRSAQAMLQTPQKPIDRQSKTPEDSAKKKRKFQSGGLAERLHRLQCRQRSAISFWKHQASSDSSAATTATVDRPGVLVLEVLEVHEECSMQLAHCEQQQPPGDGHQHSHPVSEERAHVLVLFNRETAAQLIPAARDIIHIYPPWQSLSIEDFSCHIILNTHFSQKVYSASKSADMSIPRGQLSADRHMPYYLGKIFGLLEVCRTTDESSARQVAASDALCNFGCSGVLTRHCVSLLEAIEGLGQAGSVEQDVEVVVQRVYSIPVADCFPVSVLKPRVPLRSSAAPPPPAERGKTRLCVLVQDSYGMFSVVQLHLLPCKDDLSQYCQMWQGKNCVLRGIKVVQRVTRERSSRLFSLIDSLWPPATPLKDHGSTLSMPSESRATGPAPSFCYLLSGQQSSVEPTEGQTDSLLYRHPSTRTLQDILQSETKTCRCSFIATVLYKRMQNTDVGQGEVWLVLTDPSLQEEQPERPCRRTVALCVNASCVLTSSVLKALNSPAVCRMSFRDAIKEHGVLLCVEQSIVEVCPDEPEAGLECPTKPELLPEPQATPLPQLVRLDPLRAETTPNSLCTVTGVIVGVDENTAFSWPACNHCGSDNLEMSTEGLQNFHCASCKTVVDKPDTKIQLEVFLSSSSLTNCTIKVKLQQKTIVSVLNTTALESNEFPGYDVENVLGKEVGPIAVYVRVVTRKPALWIGLEEICL
ncbi:DNA repair-scaffolding protein isoform X1 [Acanthochromis polyacanthus]|uniref:DNA repair-scaffolding protein isoform X1 n=1 Tax=Acanthochromis polyacanthus TaxID=80966 RepID=UPI002234D23E|nr:DNA repair-scaffolding protein isoform X1 [Acanthochromis polyacanthus]